MYLTQNIGTFSKVTPGLPIVTAYFCDPKIVIFGGSALFRHKKLGVIREKVGQKTSKTQRIHKNGQFLPNNVIFPTGHSFHNILILKQDFKYCLCPIEGFSLIFYLSLHINV